jgi:hypothetical protein
VLLKFQQLSPHKNIDKSTHTKIPFTSINDSNLRKSNNAHFPRTAWKLTQLITSSEICLIVADESQQKQKSHQGHMIKVCGGESEDKNKRRERKLSSLSVSLSLSHPPPPALRAIKCHKLSVFGLARNDVSDMGFLLMAIDCCVDCFNLRKSKLACE